MATWLETWCVERGMVLTGQRRVISQVLCECGVAPWAPGGDERPDPVAVHRRAVLRDPRITLTAVCRTLQWLDDVRAVGDGDGDGDGGARPPLTSVGSASAPRA